jgi:hypothetical protein
MGTGIHPHFGRYCYIVESGIFKLNPFIANFIANYQLGRYMQRVLISDKTLNPKKRDPTSPFKLTIKKERGQINAPNYLFCSSRNNYGEYYQTQ